MPLDFTLDPESSRRYVNFGGQAWDRELEAFVPTRPSMLISRSTGWRFKEYHGAQFFDDPLPGSVLSRT